MTIYNPLQDIEENQETIDVIADSVYDPLKDKDDASEPVEQVAPVEEQKDERNILEQGVDLVSTGVKNLHTGFRAGESSTLNTMANFSKGLDVIEEEGAKLIGVEPSGMFGKVEEVLRGRSERAMPKDRADDLGGMITEGFGEAPSAILEYATGTKLFGSIIGFAAVDALREVDKGGDAAAIAAIKGALTGGVFKSVEHLTAAAKALVLGAFGSGSAAAQGADAKEITKSGVVLGALGMMGGKDTTLKQAGKNAKQSIVEDVKTTYKKIKAKADAKSKEVYDPAAHKVDDNLNRIVREEHKTTGGKIKQALKRQFSPQGLMPETAKKSNLKREGKINAEEFLLEFNNVQFEKSLQKGLGKKYKDLTEIQELELKAELKGKTTNLPQNVKDTLGAMRKQIDSLSKSYSEKLRRDAEVLVLKENTKEAAEKYKLMETLLSNEGKYVNSSYRAFDDPKWFSYIPKKDIQSAREFLEKQFEADANPKQKAQIVIQDLLKTGTAYDSFASYIKESKVGAKDLSVLISKKDIAPPIKKLLGEYNDPRLLYSKTVSKLSRLNFNDDFLREVRREGEGKYLFEKENRPIDEHTVPIAGKTNETYAPLNGMFTYPEVNQAFKDVLGKSNLPDWYRKTVQLNGIVKMGKVVISPTTMSRNFVAASMFAMANGHFNLSKMKIAADSLNTFFNKDGSKLDYLKMLKEKHVIHESPYAGEMMDFIAESKINLLMKEREGATISNEVKSGTKKSLDFLKKAYQYGDDFWKIVGFENEVDIGIKYRGLNRQQAEDYAADRIINTYPTYSQIGKGMVELRRFPLAGDFVAFTSESIRTSMNILKNVKEDFKIDKGLGVQRLAGAAIASAGVYGLQKGMQSSFDMDQEEVDAYRLMVPEWSKNSNFMPLGRDDDGSLLYMDMTFADPYAYFKKPLNALMRDDIDYEEAALHAVKEMYEPFFGKSISYRALKELSDNRKENGGKIYTEKDPEAWKDIARHLKKGFQPGVMRNLDEIFDAGTGKQNKTGQKKEMSEALANIFGVRVSRLNPKTALFYRSYDFSSAMRDASGLLNKMATDPNEKTQGEIENTYMNVLGMRKQMFADMSRLVHATRKMGVDDDKIEEILKLQNISTANREAIMEGYVPDYILSNRFMKKGLKISDTFHDEETKQRLENRRESILELESIHNN